MQSFKERVAEAAVAYAQKYKDVYLDHEYLLCSGAFSNQGYYIISAHADNYRHLIGVNTKMSADDFFQKCISKTLEVNFSEILVMETAARFKSITGRLKSFYRLNFAEKEYRNRQLYKKQKRTAKAVLFVIYLRIRRSFLRSGIRFCGGSFRNCSPPHRSRRPR